MRNDCSIRNTAQSTALNKVFKLGPKSSFLLLAGRICKAKCVQATMCVEYWNNRQKRHEERMEKLLLDNERAAPSPSNIWQRRETRSGPDCWWCTYTFSTRIRWTKHEHYVRICGDEHFQIILHSKYCRRNFRNVPALFAGALLYYCPVVASSILRARDQLRRGRLDWQRMDFRRTFRSICNLFYLQWRIVRPPCVWAPGKLGNIVAVSPNSTEKSHRPWTIQNHQCTLSQQHSSVDLIRQSRYAHRTV